MWNKVENLEISIIKWLLKFDREIFALETPSQARSVEDAWKVIKQEEQLQPVEWE